MLPNPASATVDAERTNSCRRVSPRFARIAIVIEPPSSNHDERCPLNLTPDRRFFDSGPKVLRQTDDSGRRPNAPLLSPPVADAAGLARPGLDPGVARLRIERIAVALRQLDACRAARTLDMRNLHPGSLDHGFAIGALFRARGRSVAAVGLGFDRNRCKLRFRPKPLRRQHRLGKIE